MDDGDDLVIAGSLVDADRADLTLEAGGYGLRRGDRLLGLIALRPGAVELAAQDCHWRVEQEGSAWDFLARALPGQEPVARFERGGMRAGGDFTLFPEDIDLTLRRAGWLASRWELCHEDGLTAAFETRRKPALTLALGPAARLIPRSAGLLLMATWIVTALRGFDLAALDTSGDALM